MASEMSCLCGDRTPIVVSPVGESYRRFSELGGGDVVEGSQLNGDIVTSNFFNVPSSEGTYAADFTKEVMPNLVVELVIGQLALTGEQTKRLRLDDYVPVPGLRADRAIALVG